MNNFKKIVSLFALSSVIVLNHFSPAYAMGRKPATFQIEMTVDFGPANKPGYHDKMYVEKGTTPKEAVSQVFPMQAGKACCSLREVIGIDGVKVNPAKNQWWICLVNGSKKISPQKKKLKAGDVVEWKFIEESQ
jgi:hypothetical protein